MEIYETKEFNAVKFEIDGKEHIGTITEIPVYGRFDDFIGFGLKVKFNPTIIPFLETKKIKILGTEVEFYCGDSNTIISLDLRETSLMEGLNGEHKISN